MNIMCIYNVYTLHTYVFVKYNHILGRLPFLGVANISQKPGGEENIFQK